MMRLGKACCILLFSGDEVDDDCWEELGWFCRSSHLSNIIYMDSSVPSRTLLPAPHSARV